MDAVKRAVIWLCELSGIKKVLVLALSALVFALPFMTKSLVSLTAVGGFSAVFGWCGLSVLFINIFSSEKTLKRVLCSLFCFFFAFYVFVYSWFVSLYPLDFAGLGNLESIGVVLIPLTLIPLIHSGIMTICMSAGYLAAKGTSCDAVRAVIVSFGYVLGEYFQSVGTLAFPWTRLFIGQTNIPSILQSASLFGSYFITFVMVLVNALIAFSIVGIKNEKKKSGLYFVLAVAVFTVNLVYGFVRINTFDTSDAEKMSAVVLQGNIPSGVKWSGEVDEKEIYYELAEDAQGVGADSAVMPETAFPMTLYPYDGFDTDAEKTLMHISDMLDAELFTGAFNIEDGKKYNSIFVFNKDGVVTKAYNKNNIVPFGEFLPYRRIVETIAPVLAEINMLSSDISRGGDFVPLETKAGKAACLVCFDSIFPETARKQVENGAKFIVDVTNDSWYKTSSAIYQHADQAVMRAVENNVPVIRSANTGVSRIIDNFGRIVEQSNVNERTSINASVFLTNDKTLYTRTGDLVVPTALVVILIFVVAGFLKQKKPSTNNGKLLNGNC